MGNEKQFKEINEYLVRRLAGEQHLKLDTVKREEAEKGNITFVLGSSSISEQLYLVMKTGKGFNYETINALGLDNCCKYIEAVFDQYIEYYKKKKSGNIYEARSAERITGSFDGFIGAYYKDEALKQSIPIPGIAPELDEKTNELYKEVKKSGKIWSDSNLSIKRVCLLEGLTSAYNHIMDYVEGVSYYDHFTKSYHRMLSPDFKIASDKLLGVVAQRYGISIDEAREKMRNILNSNLKKLVDTIQERGKKEEKLLHYISKHSNELQTADDSFKGDKEFLLEVVKIDPFALAYAFDEVKEDPDFMLEALKIDSRVFSEISPKLKNDPNFISKLDGILDREQLQAYGVNVNDHNLDRKKIESKHEEDRKLLTDEERDLLNYIKIHDNELQTAPDAFKKDKGFLLEVAKVAPGALTYASDEVRKDPDFMLEVAKINPIAFYFAHSPELRNDPEFTSKISSIIDPEFLISFGFNIDGESLGRKK